VERHFSIRPAAAHEMTTVAVLFRGYAASLGVDLSFQGFEGELTSLPGAYAAPGGSLLLAVSPQTADPLGCVAIRKLAEAGACEMKRLYVSPDARGMGLGRALAVAAMETAIRTGYRTMRLDTLPLMSSAQALYRSLGFEATRPYYDTPVAGTMFMRKTLIRP
jgi:ribosomal protein S18 acetylase RimI-like enzyme